MNHAIAKIKQKGTVFKYRKILTGETLYRLPDNLSPHVEYSPTHNLDEDCWFGIDNFSQKEYCLDILQRTFISAEYCARLTNEEVDNIDFIFSYQDENLYYFQNITKSLLQYRRYIALGDEYTFNSNSRDISINSVPDAIYIKDIDTLYFKKLSSLSGIFRGIDSLYREATQEETASFLESDFISLQEGYSVENVKQANRKRIAMAVDTLNRYDDAQRTAVFDCIRDYCPNLIAENDAFKISNEQELKLLLYGIEQRFYTTPDGRERRIANSVIVINQ
jgi:hypothetical protein